VREFGPTAALYEAVVVSVIAWSMLIILVTSAAHLETSDVARRRAERALLMVKRIDPLTKTLNRFGISEKLEAAWAEFKGGGAMFGMLMLDGDYFRRINDTFGHGVGDGVLERVAATLQPQLRDHDALGRWSGEEFLILLKIKAQRDLDVVAGRLRNALKDVNSPFPAGLDGEPMSITASFGISEMRENDDTPADTLMRADAALHMAKDAGQDHIVT
jgi:diguanylate cyclase (GGDEF)-like protein